MDQDDCELLKLLPFLESLVELVSIAETISFELFALTSRQRFSLKFVDL